MIDWHSHILPEMDDGSKDLSESLSMLDALRDQGIESVVASPHFYANDEPIETFLERRRKSFDLLMENLSEDHPKVICGAEVRYYSGISKMLNLENLAIGSTRFILLEMPIGKWTEYTVRELIELASTRGLTVILAHIERYWALQSAKVWNRLYDCGILMQVNASFICTRASRRKAFKMLNDGRIHFIGSDCHNMTTRSPKIGEAYELISKKFGEDYLYQMNEYGKSILNKQ